MPSSDRFKSFAGFLFLTTGVLWVRLAGTEYIDGAAGQKAPQPLNLHRPASVPVGNPSAGSKSDELFAKGSVPRIRIDVPPEAWDSLRRSPRRYVLAKVREGNTVYTNVGIHLKGSAGSFRPVDDSPSFTLNFGKFADGQKFHGLKKIHLNRSPQDPSYLSEMISRELCLAGGVLTARAGHCIASVNRKDSHLYVLLEGVNGPFLKRHFQDSSGNLYDGTGARDITERLKVNEGDKPRDVSRLNDLVAACRVSDLTQRAAALSAVLDVDGFLRMIAMENILGHWDGYLMNHNNYRVFHDKARDRMVFLPHGMDQLLNRDETALFKPPLNGMAAKAVMAVPEFRKQYRAIAANLATNAVNSDAIRKRLREVTARLQPLLTELDPNTAAAQRNLASNLEKRLVRRAISIRQQANPGPSPGTATPVEMAKANFEPRLDLGPARHTRETGPDGGVLLKIFSPEPCTASWRTRLNLSEGRYRLMGRIRTSEVELDSADPRAGVGFRVSRQRNLPKQSGTRDWTPLSLEFDVNEAKGEVEIIGELRVLKGTVWIDSGSLKLERL